MGSIGASAEVDPSVPAGVSSARPYPTPAIDLAAESELALNILAAACVDG